MTSKISEKIFGDHPTRFTKDEKLSFLNTAKTHFSSLGYKEDEINVWEKGNNRNLVIGDAKTAEYFITAHYDTPGNNGWMLFSTPLLGQTGANIITMFMWLPFIILEIIFGYIAEDVGMDFFTGRLFTISPVLLLLVVMILSLCIKNKTNRNDNTSGVLSVMKIAQLVAEDPALRKKCCFVLFDNEEWGLLGSAAFASQCTKKGIPVGTKTVINLDCVGVGDTLVAATTGKPSAKVTKFMDKLDENGAQLERVVSRMIYMSDHANFKSSLMLCYMSKSKLGPLYIPNIHCGKDTQCDISMTDDLAEKVIRSIS